MEQLVGSRPEGILDEKNRQPTNKFWIIPFVIAVITFIVLGVLATTMSGPRGIAFIHHDGSRDTRGSSCGFDSDVLDKGLAIKIYKHESSDFICVDECPKGSFDASNCNPLNYLSVKKGLVCKSQRIKDSISNCLQMNNEVELGNCVGYYEDPYEFLGNCFSRSSTSSIHADSDEVEVKVIETEFVDVVLAFIPSFVYAIVIAGIVSLFFALTLKWSAAFVFWGFVSLVLLVLTCIIIGVVVIGLTDDKIEDRGMFIGVPCGIISITLLIFLVCLYCFREKIRCGIEIVKESSRAVCASFGSIFFPLLPFLLRAGVVIATIYMLIMGYTMTDNHYEVSGLNGYDGDCKCHNAFYSNGDVCDPNTFNTNCRASDGGICTSAVCKLVSQEPSSLITPFVVATFMLSIWIVAFIQANSKMILAHMYGNWYWNFNREFIPTGHIFTSMGKVLGNHTGTAAFGAFVVMICRVLKSLLSRRNGNRNGGIDAIIGAIIVEMVRCCAQAFLEIVEFVSDKAFVVVAIMGTGFWDSVKFVSKTMVKDIPLVVATEYVGDIILFVCKFVAALLSAGLFYFTSPLKGDDIGYTIFMTFIIFLFAFDLAGVLLTAYNVAIDTLLICTLQDYMHCGEEKSYFKSQTLNSLLLKKKEEQFV